MKAARKLLEQRFCCCCSASNQKLAEYGPNGITNGKDGNGVTATYTVQNGKAPTIITTQPSGRSSAGKDRLQHVNGIHKGADTVVDNPEPGEFDEIDLNNRNGDAPPNTILCAEAAHPPLSVGIKSMVKRDAETSAKSAANKTEEINALSSSHGGEHSAKQQLAEAVTDMMLNEIRENIDEVDEYDIPLIEEDASNIDLYAISEANDEELTENFRSASGSSAAKVSVDDEECTTTTSVTGKSNTPNVQKERSREYNKQVTPTASASRSVSTSSVCSTATPSMGSSGGTPSPRKPPRTNLHMMFNTDGRASNPTSQSNSVEESEREVDRSKVEASKSLPFNQSTGFKHAEQKSATESIPPTKKLMRTNRMYANVDEESSDEDESETSKHFDDDEKPSSSSMSPKSTAVTTAIVAAGSQLTDVQTSHAFVGSSMSESKNNKNKSELEGLSRITKNIGSEEDEHTTSKESDKIEEVQFPAIAPKENVKQFEYNMLESDPSERTN